MSLADYVGQIGGNTNLKTCVIKKKKETKLMIC